MESNQVINITLVIVNTITTTEMINKMNKMITITISFNNNNKKNNNNNTIRPSRVSINSKIKTHPNQKGTIVLLILLITVIVVTLQVARLYLFSKLKTNQTS